MAVAMARPQMRMTGKIDDVVADVGQSASMVMPALGERSPPMASELMGLALVDPLELEVGERGWRRCWDWRLVMRPTL